MATRDASSAQSLDVKKLTDALHKSADDAGASLSPEEREAYRASKDSVVRARRAAETVEGQLRIG